MPKNVVRPASVWATGNRSPRQQIVGRYIGATRSDAALPPVIARWIIETYTAPGEIVCDPNPGPGLVLAEAVRAGRRALALPTQPRWESALEANLDLARLAGAAGRATLLDGIDDPRAADLPGAVDLVLTGLRHTPASDPSRVLVGLYEDLDAVANWVWPGGHVVVTCRPWRRRGRLVDLPGQIHEAADAVGLVPVDHCIALIAPMHEHQVRPRRSARVGDHPEDTDLHGCRTTQPAHLDVFVFQLPSTARHSMKGGGQ